MISVCCTFVVLLAIWLLVQSMDPPRVRVVGTPAILVGKGGVHAGGPVAFVVHTIHYILYAGKGEFNVLSVLTGSRPGCHRRRRAAKRGIVRRKTILCQCRPKTLMT